MNHLRASLLVFSLAALAACGDDPTGPTPASVAGTYHATQIDITYTGSSEPQDALELGASLEIVLTAEGTTSGTFFVPAVLTEDGVDDDVFDLTGTYSISGNTLTFPGPANSFIRDLPWTIGNGTLTATDTHQEGTLELRLTRLP
jgi:hypothetical protein